MRIPASSERKTLLSRRLSRRSLVGGALFGATSVIAGCGFQGTATTSEAPLDLQPHYPNEELLIDFGWLAARINDPSLRLLDCSPLAKYRDGHLPGARHVWWQDTIELHNPVYGMLVNAGGRAELARSSGVRPESQVVCYDNSGGVYAARLLWMLRYMGYRSGRLLAGGCDEWRAAGYELTLDEASDVEGGIDDIFDESVVAQPGDILERLDEPGLVILDTRTASEQAETWNGRLRVGAIPGSQWIPRGQFLQGGAVPATADELVSRLGSTIDLNATAEVIVYGLHGTLAALPYHLLLALNRFHVRLYDGSWAQWGSDSSLPLQALEGNT